MILTNNNYYEQTNNNYYEQTNINNKIKIFKANDLVNDMAKEVEKYTKLLQLVKQDRVDAIKNVVRYLDYNFKIIQYAQKWLSIRDKVDKRHNYEEKDCFSYLSNKINELFDCNVNITNIMFLNYTLVWEIQFEYKDNIYEFAIPNLEELNVQDFDLMCEGKLVLRVQCKDNKSSWDFICSSYEETDITKGFKEFINIGDDKNM